jgi:two-component system phosphate regulon sensor histidine kinase PhoR
MKRDTIPMSRVWRPVAIASLPVVIVLGALVALDALAFKAAFFSALAAVAALAVLVRRHFDDLDTIRDYADDLATQPETPAPQSGSAQVLPQLVAAIRRLGRAQAARAGGSGQLAEIGLEHLPDPTVVLDTERRVTGANAAARQLFGPDMIGHDLAVVARTPALLNGVDDVLYGHGRDTKVEFTFALPVERTFSAHIARLIRQGENWPSVVIVLYDMTTVKRSERMRSDFIANASHELRTPLSVLLGCIQTMRGSARDDPDAQAEFFGLMEGQAGRMARLVDDFLALSRIELNEHTLPDEQVDIADVIDHVANALAVPAETRGIRIRPELDGALPRVTGDRDELVQVLQNLIDNAVKYAAENSVVQVRARVATAGIPPALTNLERALVLAVEDHGDGIAPEHLPRLTERFYRVDTARSRQMGGTGLGLAIVKHVVNRHRGALTVESTPGQGSTFSVWLPLGEVPALPAPEKDSRADDEGVNDGG